MLSIRPIGSTNQQVSYYVNLGREDYYITGDEAPGVWLGDGAVSLGLSGQVQGNHLRELMLGFSIDGERKLVQNAGKPNRRSAFDLTFSVPKSVSAVWSLSDFDARLEIERRCERAVRKAASAFQTLCGISRRGHDGVNVEESRLAMALFRHETARGLSGEVPDPNLHWHLVVPNVAVRPDGTTGAFDARKLFQRNMKMALGALFRAELSKELAEMNFRSYRPRKPNRDEPVSWFELELVPPELVAAMSKRRREIEKWLTKHGLSGAKNAEKAAITTRHNKWSIPREHLLEAWQKLGQEFNLTSDSIALHLRESERENVDRHQQVEKALNRAMMRITDHEAYFTEIELLRFAAEESQCNGVGIDIVLAEVLNALANHTEIVPLGRENGEQVFTTREMLEIEKQLFKSAQVLSCRHSHAVSAKTLDEALGKFSTLRPEQISAIRHIASGSDIACVNGTAGTGKTFMLSAANQVWQVEGFNVIGTALAANAAKTLQRDSGICSTHIHSLLYDIKSQNINIDRKTILVCDEAGMVGTRILNQLATIAKNAGAKLVLIGDHRQLQAISAGAPFRVIGERFGCIEMNEIKRQRETWAKEAVYDFRDGRAQNALASYYERGLFWIGDDRDSAISQLVEDWKTKAIDANELRDTLVFAATNLEVALINEACQQTRIASGELGREGVSIGGSEFFENDRVVVTRNLRSLGLRNGSLGTVKEVDKQRCAIRVGFDKGLNVWINLDEFSEIKLAYAVSTHKGQGQTVENSFVLLGGPMTDRELSYVQGSRARGETRLYSDIITCGDSIQSLAGQMNRSRAKKMAHENDRVIC